MLESFGIPLPGETALIFFGLLAVEGALQHRRGDRRRGRRGDHRRQPRLLADRPPRRPRALPAQRWLKRWADSVHPAAERLMQRHGGKTVFFGRFIAILRFTAAWVAGLGRMPWWRFLFWNAAGGIVWATAVGARRVLRRQGGGGRDRAVRRSSPPAASPRSPWSAASSSRSHLLDETRPAKNGAVRAAWRNRRRPAELPSGMLAAISRALEERDQTHGHGARVAALAEPVARAARVGARAPRVAPLRRAAPRHRQGLDRARRPPQDGPADASRSSARSAATRAPAPSSCCRSAPPTARCRTSSSTTSAGTATATRPGCAAARSRSRRASSPSPTRSTR